MTSGALIHSGLEEAPEQREKGGDEAYMALEEWVGLLVGRERELGLGFPHVWHRPVLFFWFLVCLFLSCVRVCFEAFGF